MRGIRRRKVRFPLIMNENQRIRRIEELQKYGNPIEIMSYYDNGKLETWLRDRYYDEIADKISELSTSTENFLGELMTLLGMETNETTISINKIKSLNQKKEKIRSITDDRDIINNYENVALSDEEFNDFMFDESIDTIYLYSENNDIFHIQSINHPVKIIGIKKDTVVDMGNFTFNALEKLMVSTQNITGTTKKLERVRNITSDEDIIHNFDKVAFDDEEFNDFMLDESIDTIYLYSENNDMFHIHSINHPVKIIGIKKDTVVDIGNYTFDTLEKLMISTQNITGTTKKMERVRNITSDEDIIHNFDKVAFDDEEFNDFLLDKSIDTIYLYSYFYGNCNFYIKNINHNVRLIGINNVTVDIGDYLSVNDLNDNSKYKVTISENIETTSIKIKKAKIIKAKYPDSKYYINHIDEVAVDYRDLIVALNRNDIECIYLCGDTFTIPLCGGNKVIKPIQNEKCQLSSPYKYSDYLKLGIFFEGFRDFEYSLDFGERFTYGNYNGNDLEWIVVGNDILKHAAIIVSTTPITFDEQRINSYDDLREWINSYWIAEVFDSDSWLLNSKNFQIQLLSHQMELSINCFPEFKNIPNVRVFYETWYNGRHLSKYNIYPVMYIKGNINYEKFENSKRLYYNSIYSYPINHIIF